MSAKESLKSVRSEKQAKEEESTKKSAAVMAKFFTKKPSKPAGTGSMAKESYSVVVVDKRNDFDRTFFPFVVRKNVHLAPQNWFLSRQKEVVVLDVDEQMPADQNACPRGMDL
jgi:chromatin assembly factor 1 subunit A